MNEHKKSKLDILSSVSFILMLISIFFFTVITTTYSFAWVCFAIVVAMLAVFIVTTVYKTKRDRSLYGRKNQKLAKWIPFYIIMLPALIYLLINNILPLYGITIAFRKTNISQGVLINPFWGVGKLSEYSFFQNFVIVFNSGILGRLIFNTISYNLVFLVIGIVFPIAVAILFDTIRNRVAKKVFQTLILMPHIISYVIISYLAYAFLAPNIGYLTRLFGGVDFYHSPQYWPAILIFVHTWKSIGFGMVVYLAGLSGIDPAIYEAAKIDGASWWQRVFRITIPQLKTLIITMFILNLARVMVSDFGLFYQVPKNMGVLYETTQTLDVYVYNKLINGGNFANTSAVSLFQSVIGFVLVIVSNLVVKKIDKESALF